MTNALIAFAASIAELVGSAAPLLAAIRVGPNRHITGLIHEGDTIVTTDQELPALDTYTIVLSNRMLMAARPGPRDPGSNIAVLRLDAPWPAVNPQIAATTAGSLVLLIGAAADGSPTVRMTVVHRFIHTGDGPAPVLDLPAGNVEQGSLVIDVAGRLVGLATLGPAGEAMAVPSAAIARVLTPNLNLASPRHTVAPPSSPNSRGWLGVALQPITVPDQLVVRAGQSSGRMVVSITKSGPAEMAGLRVGDVLLALNGTSTSGPQALRAFLGAEPVGAEVEVKLLRDGNVLAMKLTIAAQPG